MIEKKGLFFGGLGLLAGFVLILVLIFMPLFKGQNGLNFLDTLYNSISKGSAYYIPGVKEDSRGFIGNTVDVSLELATPLQSEQALALFLKGSDGGGVSGNTLTVKGDLGEILANCLSDADLLYHNKGTALVEKYGYNEKRVMFNWWISLNVMERVLKSQKKFKEAKGVALVVKKAVEPAYNYYGITPRSIKDKYGIVIFSLVFYVAYTLWYGFAILFMFEGWGLKLEN